MVVLGIRYMLSGCDWDQKGKIFAQVAVNEGPRCFHVDRMYTFLQWYFLPVVAAD